MPQCANKSEQNNAVRGKYARHIMVMAMPALSLQFIAFSFNTI